MSCGAGYISSYKWGIEEQQKKKRDAAITTRSYDVRAFVTSGGPQSERTHLERLCTLIKQTIEPDSWDSREFSITPFPANKSLVIVQTGQEHDRIQRLFRDLQLMVQMPHR